MSDIHDIDKIGHTKKDRKFYVVYYRFHYIYYIIFMAISIAMLVLVDLIESIS